jgi:hypothetical protein
MLAFASGCSGQGYVVDWCGTLSRAGGLKEPYRGELCNGSRYGLATCTA